MSVKKSLEKQSQEREQFQEEAQGRLDNVLNPFMQSGFGVSGTKNEVSGRLEGLERAKILTGQNPYQIGQDYQEAYGNIKKRTTLSDTGSELLRANKAGAVADARNQLQADGVKGGAALGAVSQVERAKSYDVNNQLQQAQRQAEQDYLNATKANANFTQASEMNFAQLAAGKDVRAPASTSGGFMDTVICTEMYKQGYYSLEVYEADQLYGLKMMTEKPHVYNGYRLWADPVVWLMQRSTIFSFYISLVAVPWAENMAGRKNTFGAIISFIGEPLCGLLGRIILRGENKYASNKTK